MNIFKTTGDILGCHNKETADSSLSSFYDFARQIRMQLGKRGYLLDNYLSLFFEAVNDNLAVNASEMGFESAETYQALCVQVLNNSYDLQDSPLYTKLLDILKEYPVISSFQESVTQRNLLYALAADMFVADAVTQFETEQKESMSTILDIIQLGDLFRQISNVIGESMAEALNRKLRQNFLAAPLVPIFLQAFTNDLLFKLSYRDCETSRQIFQLLLDNLPDNK